MRMTHTLGAFTAALLFTTAVHAAQQDMKSSIDALPEAGAISISGVVDRVVDGDTFILRDTAGKTIDVHTASNLTVKKGDHVSVKGEKTAEIAGMGEEIKATSVTAGVANFGKERVASTTDSVSDRVASATDSTMDKVERTVDKLAVGTPRATDETPYANKNNKAALPDTAYDVDVDRTADGVNISTTASTKAANAGEANAFPADGNDRTVGTAVSADAAVKANTSASLNSIDNLPESGAVALKGTVARVGDENNFTLRDGAGKTIQVETASNIELQPGDAVSVNGTVSDRLLGFGRQIERAEVITVGSN